MHVNKKETAQALAWLAQDNTRKPHQACDKFGVSPSTLSRAIRRQMARMACPTCGQKVYDEALLKSPLPKIGRLADMKKVAL